MTGKKFYIGQNWLPSVHWRCWLGSRKGIQPVKNWVVGCWHGFLSGARCRLAYAQLMPLQLTVSCFSEIQIGFAFLVPAHQGSPGQRAVKCVCVCVVASQPSDSGSKIDHLKRCQKEICPTPREESSSVTTWIHNGSTDGDNVACRFVQCPTVATKSIREKYLSWSYDNDYRM